MNIHGGYYGDNNVVDYSVNINPLGLSPDIRQAIISSIDEIDKYPEIKGTTTRNAIAEYLHIDCNKIIMGNGASELIYLYARAIKPKKVLIIEPTFNEYRRAFQLVGSDIYDYVLDSNNDFIFNVDEFATMMNRVNPDVVVLCNPNNPTGKLIDEKELLDIIEIIRNNNSFIFIDESFIEFSDRKSIIYKSDYDNILSLRSMTKYYAIPGIRIGYAVSNDKVINKMEEYKEPWTMNTFALNIVPKIIHDIEFHHKISKWITTERDYMYSQLSKIKNITVYKSYSNFFLCKSNYFSGNMLNLQLLEKNMYIRVCDNFQSLNDKFIRIAIKKHEDNEKLINVLKNIID